MILAALITITKFDTFVYIYSALMQILLQYVEILLQLQLGIGRYDISSIFFDISYRKNPNIDEGPIFIEKNPPIFF